MYFSTLSGGEALSDVEEWARRRRVWSGVNLVKALCVLRLALHYHHYGWLRRVCEAIETCVGIAVPDLLTPDSFCRYLMSVKAMRHIFRKYGSRAVVAEKQKVVCIVGLWFQSN
jgi:hypothetical protein